MSKITRTTVASGVIGRFNHEWEVIRLYDKKYNSESYELYINEMHFASAESTAEALSILVEQVQEEKI